MITVAEYNNVEQLKPLADLWERFFERTPDPCFSHSWDWLSGLDSTNAKLRVLLGSVSGRPFGFLPLQVESRKTEFGEFRVLTNAGSRFFPFAGPVGPHTTAMLTAGMRHLHRSPRDWDLIEFDLLHPSETERSRWNNTFQLMKWHCEVESRTEWQELSPSMEPPVRFAAGASKFTMERMRAEDHASLPWPMLARCLSLVEELEGPDVARQLRAWHQTGFRAGRTDWTLLRENGVPQAAALNLLTRGRWLCTALVGRTEMARFELLRRLLEGARWEEDDMPLVVRSIDIPFAKAWSNATPVGFRYTHVSPWAWRARWWRFRQRISSRWNRPDIQEIACDSTGSRPVPPRPKLSIYCPSPTESLNV